MDRRAFVRTLGVGGAGALTCVVRPRAIAQGDSRPNFVIVLCDDLGHGDLGCYGHSEIQTPCLDQFAHEGLRLTDCYAAAPVCSPARAGMLTGRTPNRCGIYDWIPAGSPMHLQREELTIATLLRDAGYSTCHVGKWHCNGHFNSAEQPQPGDHGFDHWFSTQNNASPSHRNPRNFVRNGEPVGPLLGYSSGLIVKEAISWLRTTGPQQPFCLFVWFHSPHEPVATGARYAGMYPRAAPTERAIYYGNVSQLDAEFGRLMGTLDDMDLRENTLVMFTSDNGPETLRRYRGAERSYGSPGPLRGMKLHMYEGGIRVPGLIRWPRHTMAGAESAEPICGVDVLPTLCEIAGLSAPSDRPIDGASFLPALRGAPVQRQVPLYWQYNRAIGEPKVAIRDGHWKLLARGDLSRFELYNLRDDLAETTDLSIKEPVRVKRMAEVLTEMHAEVKAEGPTWPA